MIPASFYTKAEYRLSRGMPVDTVFELADSLKIEHTEVDEWLKNRQTLDAKKQAIGQGQEAIYNTLDEIILEKRPHLVAVRRGDNSEFYEYRAGVYTHITKQDMLNLVDTEMYEQNLHAQRANRKKVEDTTKRIASALTRLNRVYTDEDAHKQAWRINLQNGLLDPETRILHPHTPDYFSTSQVPFPYDAEATAPMFEEFVSKISNGDEKFPTMLQQMFGYCLMDGNPKHKVFYLYGSTARNGKSTSAKILMGLLGKGNCTTLSLSQLSNDNNRVLQGLVGKQLNFSDEVSSKYIESSLLTTLSAEGVIHIDPKFKDSYDYQVRAKFVVACNDIPRFESGQGMQKRMHILPFDYHIPETERVERYDEKLLEKEGSGILNWALAGLHHLKETHTFLLNDRSLEDLEDARLESNPVHAYLEDAYKFGADYTDTLPTASIYGTPRVGTGKDCQHPTGYFAYCEQAGIRPLSRMKFSKELSRYADMTNKIAKCRDKDDEGKPTVRGYVGLMKRIPTSAYEEEVF
jgi:P4 family phage/plasmid primase-like protien